MLISHVKGTTINNFNVSFNMKVNIKYYLVAFTVNDCLF